MRKKFIFSGQVQGVGFRYQAKKLALRYGLAGWVKNENDGRVILVYEGALENIEKAIDYLKNFFNQKIKNIEAMEEKEEKLREFEIKF